MVILLGFMIVLIDLVLALKVIMVINMNLPWYLVNIGNIVKPLIVIYPFHKLSFEMPTNSRKIGETQFLFKPIYLVHFVEFRF